MAAKPTQVSSGCSCDGNTVKTTILFVLCAAVFVAMISLPDMQATDVTVSNTRPGYQVIHIDQENRSNSEDMIEINQTKHLKVKSKELSDDILGQDDNPYTASYFADLDQRMRNADALIYNRVPKCGSTATFQIMKTISKKQPIRYSYHASRIFHTEHVDIQQTKMLIKNFKSFKKPWVFQRHLHFLNVSQYNMSMPMYINLVRDPTDRFVSQYYFYRFEHRKKMSEQRRNMTFDTCVFENYSECQTKEAFVIIPFFCGQAKMCLEPTREALERAKQNVDKYYGAVGITEDLNPTYALIEKTMPHFFRDMSAIAKARLSGYKSKFKTHKKPPSSPEALRIMKSRLGLENEFYAFVKKRYTSFLKHYGIDSPLLHVRDDD